MLLSLQLTYKELKLDKLAISMNYVGRLQLTYKELKLNNRIVCLYVIYLFVANL